MKFFSLLSIVISTFLIGYIFIVGLPKLAKLTHSSKEVAAVVTNLPTAEAALKEQTELILRDKCNTYIVENNFAGASAAESYLDRCLRGEETASINVIRPSVTSGSSTQPDSARLSQTELVEKCNNFMTRAKFPSQKAANLFLENCLAGK